jgi:hypothetical protein
LGVGERDSAFWYAVSASIKPVRAWFNVNDAVTTSAFPATPARNRSPRLRDFLLGETLVLAGRVDLLLRGPRSSNAPRTSTSTVCEGHGDARRSR